MLNCVLNKLNCVHVKFNLVAYSTGYNDTHVQYVPVRQRERREIAVNL